MTIILWPRTISVTKGSNGAAAKLSPTVEHSRVSRRVLIKDVLMWIFHAVLRPPRSYVLMWSLPRGSLSTEVLCSMWSLPRGPLSAEIFKWVFNHKSFLCGLGLIMAVSLLLTVYRPSEPALQWNNSFLFVSVLTPLPPRRSQ